MSFNKFPIDFYWAPAGHRKTRVRFVRAIHDGATLKVYGETNKKIELLYTAEVSDEDWVVREMPPQHDDMLLKWTDKKTGLQFSLSDANCKSCAANNARRMKLAKTLNPDA